jgi:2-methylcitrate dehydratase PrpD
VPITSSDVAAFVAEAKPGPRALSAASTAVLDTVAVLIAGSVEDATVRIASTLKPELGGNSFPSFDPAVRVRPDDAALLYGTAAHALDFDDVSMLAICHPSAPVLAALLATGNWVDLTGQQLCEAHVIGTEVMIRMGQAIGFHHYDLGFHSTATMGIFGATAAVARLRRLDREQTGNALAIAASLASGLRLNFGSMIKPVHVGVAAANALRAVEWASAGVEASRGDLFGPGGVFEAMSGGSQVTWPDDVGLGQPFAIEAPGFERKRYACCYLLHKIIALGKEASLRGMRLSEIAGFRVEMPVGGTRPLIHPFPRMGTQAMFSAPYALIAAILDGDIGFDSFDDRSVARPEIQSRLADVLIEEVAGPALTPEQIGAAPVRLELQLTDGSSVRFERFAAPGSPADPLSPEDLEAKWIDCLRRANPSLPPIDASALYAEGVAVTRSGSLEPWLENVWSAARPNAAHSVRAVSA